MIDKRISSLTAALAGITDNAVVMISGFGRAGWPTGLMAALAGLEVRRLTLVANAVVARNPEMDGLFRAGIVGRVIASIGRSPDGKTAFEQQWRAGTVELECVPQGTLVERIRAGGAGVPAFYSRVGVGTPLADGKERRSFGGVEHVLEEAITADFALVRGDMGDRYGNLSFRHTQINFAPVMAAAARCTIAEVSHFSARALTPPEIQLPGNFVDRLVLAGGADAQP